MRRTGRWLGPAVTDPAGNRLLAEMMQALRDLVRQEMVRAFERLEDWRVAAREIQTEHREILEMIESRDPSGAQARMTDHITGITVAVPREMIDTRYRGALVQYRVDVPGGTLTVRWTTDDRVLMTGPAVLVAEGIWLAAG